MKGYHVFRAGGPGENFFFEREAHNLHSKAAIKVKLDTDGSVIGHVPDGLAGVLAPLLDSGAVTSVTGTTTGPPRSAAEGVWAVGGGKSSLVNMHFTVRRKTAHNATTIAEYSEVEKTQT